MLRALLLLLALLLACDRGPWVGQLTLESGQRLEVHAPCRLNGFQRDCLARVLDFELTPNEKAILHIKEVAHKTPRPFFVFTLALTDSTDRVIRKASGGNLNRDRAFDVAVRTLFFCPE